MSFPVPLKLPSSPMDKTKKEGQIVPFSANEDGYRRVSKVLLSVYWLKDKNDDS